MASLVRFKANDILQNRYRIIRNFRTGGMGCVDIALDMLHQQYVVMKYATIEGNREKDKLTNEKVQVEAEVLRECDHPHIERFIDFFNYNGANFLILGYVDGVPLNDLVSHGPLPEHQIIQITKEILLGIAHLSQRGIIYRDLKPSNVMVQKADGHIVLIDFGTAKKGNLESPSSPSEPATCIFTPGYEAPEQLLGKVDFRTDICAVGLTMYYMSIGRNPPRQRPVPLVSNENPKISRTVAEIISKATENSPDNRYQNAMEMFWVLGGNEPMPSIARAVPTVAPPVGSPRLILKRVSAIGFNHYTEDKIFQLTKPSITLGREEPGFSIKPDIAVADRYVSLSAKGDGKPFGHARITRDTAGFYWIEDLGSRNGTFVNKERILAPVSLRNGDTITLGLYTIFEFRTD